MHSLIKRALIYQDNHKAQVEEGKACIRLFLQGSMTNSQRATFSYFQINNIATKSVKLKTNTKVLSNNSTICIQISIQTFYIADRTLNLIPMMNSDRIFKISTINAVVLIVNQNKRFITITGYKIISRYLI